MPAPKPRKKRGRHSIHKENETGKSKRISQVVQWWPIEQMAVAMRLDPGDNIALPRTARPGLNPLSQHTQTTTIRGASMNRPGKLFFFFFFGLSAQHFFRANTQNNSPILYKMMWCHCGKGENSIGPFPGRKLPPVSRNLRLGCVYKCDTIIFPNFPSIYYFPTTLHRI
jgi:hypothetical protein